MTSFDKGFLKQAAASGLPYKQALEALNFVKTSGAPISGKGAGAPEYNATTGKAAGTSKPVSATGMQKQQPSPDMQSLMARQTLPMPQPQLAPQMQPQMQASHMPAPTQMPQPGQMPTPAPMQMPKPQLAGAMQPQMQPSHMQMPQPQLAQQTAPGVIRPKLMPQMNQPQIAR